MSPNREEHYGNLVLEQTFAGVTIALYSQGFVTLSNWLHASAGHERLMGIECDAHIAKKTGIGRTFFAVATMGVNLVATPGQRGDIMLTIVTDRDTYVLRAPTPTAERLRIAQGLAATGRALIQAANMQERPLASPPATALPVESHNDASDPLLEVRRMEKLGDLFASGLVTETEFRSKRQAILDPEESLQPVQRMQRIAELLEQGLITDEEFQQKRRAILSDL